MKQILIVFFTLAPLFAIAQWTPSGTNIYNTNTGNVGIGITAPDRKFYVRGVYSTTNALSAFELQNSSGSESVAASFYAYPGSTTGNTYLKNTFVMYLGGTTGLHMNFANPKVNGAIRFHTGGFDTQSTERMVIHYNGNVGIGTSSPAYKLDVNGPINATAININGVPFTGGGNSQWTTAGSNIYFNTGNIGIGTATPNTSYKVDVSGAINASAFYLNGQVFTGGNSQWTTAGSNIYFNTGNIGIGTANPNAAYKLDVSGVINASGININGQPFAGGGSQWTTNTTNIYFSTGNVGIGTTAPDAKLAVKGTVHANEVKVDLSVPGPDYVFEKDYDLLSLEEIKTYIDKNKHLPEVPSAKEMEANGVNLGEMNMLLLKKIEELTMHVIKQQGRIEELEKKMRP